MSTAVAVSRRFHARWRSSRFDAPTPLAEGYGRQSFRPRRNRSAACSRLGKVKLSVLRRLFVDNYKCLVDFSLEEIPAIAGFVGPNGGGKTTVFGVLQALQAFLGGASAADAFPSWTRTRWDIRERQRFELDVAGFDKTALALLPASVLHCSGTACTPHSPFERNSELVVRAAESGDQPCVRTN